VTLRDGERRVYLIGVSHVSQQSVYETEALISAVKPDAVMLELCLARSGQLVREEDNFGSSQDDRAFYVAGKVKIVGVPTGEGFPAEEEVREWIGADLQPGQPLTRPNFDQLVRNALNTGIFSSVRIQAEAPPSVSLPLYMSRRRIWYKILPGRTYVPWELDEDAAKELFPVYPLGDLILNCTERTGMLATLESISLRGDVPSGLGDFQGKVLEWFKETKSTLRTLMKARKAILDLQPDSKISFFGAETKNIQINIQRLGNTKLGSNTGMEVSVYDGKGAGIMPTVTPSYSTPKAPGADDGSTWVSKRGVKWRPWTEVEKRKATGFNEYISNPVARELGKFLITQFGKYQDKAARKAKIRPGEAWQAALSAAVDNGAKMVVLGDELALVTQAKIASAFFQRALTWVLTGLLTAVAGAAIQQNPSLQDSLPVEDAYYYVYLLAAAQVVGVWASLYEPVRAMRSFARQKGTQIEEKLRLPMPLELTTGPTFLEGEDAILQWPSGKEAILDDRNKFMANTLFRMVRGLPSSCPAYVTFENTNTKDVLERFLAGPGERTDTNPEGVGLGVYETPEIRSVVAVVGTAHVHGIREEFERLKLEKPSSS